MLRIARFSENARLFYVVCFFGALFVAATALAALPVGWWWVRVLDYPRLQIAICLLLVLVVLLIFFRPLGFAGWSFVGILVAALAYQAVWIWPYTPIANRKVIASEQCDAPLRLLIANIRVGTRDVAPLQSRVERYEPDILLLLETDHWWDEALRPLAKRFATELRYPQENGYGLHFFTDLPVHEARLRFLVEDVVPSVYARLDLPNGKEFQFFGVHPQPPVPNFKNTTPRDGELLTVGQESADSDMPSVVAGDLNDVAWSSTTRLLLRTSNLLDPRQGRGIYATFPAQAPGLRWPLDHIFHTDHFAIHTLKVLDNIGSDHLPVLVELCYQDTAPMQQESEDAEPGDHERAEEIKEEGEEVAKERPGAQKEDPL
jgi:endonuclease/exonuclease/phosphatase (EEP) superfamily protein YafD